MGMSVRVSEEPGADILSVYGQEHFFGFQDCLVNDPAFKFSDSSVVRCPCIVVHHSCYVGCSSSWFLAFVFASKVLINVVISACQVLWDIPRCIKAAPS